MITNFVLKFAANRLSPVGNNARLSILIYHRVKAQTDPIFPNETTSARFDQEMSELKSTFNVLPLGQAIERLKTGQLPARAACVTFDDGYADNLHIALPILQKHKLTATFFIATGYLNGGRMFNDTVIESIRRSRHKVVDLKIFELGTVSIESDAAKAQIIGQLLRKIKYLVPSQRLEAAQALAEITHCGALPTDFMMTSEELKRLHASGMEIGGHTSTHPILAKLDEPTAKRDIADGKDFLEHLLGEKIHLFAYPNGKPGIDFLPEQARIVESVGFTGAVTTQPGSASNRSDVFQLPRFTPWRPQIRAFVPQLLGNLRS